MDILALENASVSSGLLVNLLHKGGKTETPPGMCVFLIPLHDDFLYYILCISPVFSDFLH